MKRVKGMYYNIRDEGVSHYSIYIFMGSFFASRKQLSMLA